MTETKHDLQAKNILDRMPEELIKHTLTYLSGEDVRSLAMASLSEDPASFSHLARKETLVRLIQWAKNVKIVKAYYSGSGGCLDPHPIDITFSALEKKISINMAWKQIEHILTAVIRQDMHAMHVAMLLDFLAACGDSNKRKMRAEALYLYRDQLAYLEWDSAILEARSFLIPAPEAAPVKGITAVNHVPDLRNTTASIHVVINGTVNQLDFINAFCDITIPQSYAADVFLNDQPFMTAIHGLRQVCLTPMTREFQDNNDQDTLYMRKVGYLTSILIGLGAKIPFYHETLERLLQCAANIQFSHSQRQLFKKELDKTLTSSMHRNAALLEELWFIKLVKNFAEIYDKTPGYEAKGNTDKYDNYRLNDHGKPFKFLLSHFSHESWFIECLRRWSEEENCEFLCESLVKHIDPALNHLDLIENVVVPGLLKTYRKYESGSLESIEMQAFKHLRDTIPYYLLNFLSLLPVTAYTTLWFKDLLKTLTEEKHVNADAMARLLKFAPAECLTKPPYHGIIRMLLGGLSSKQDPRDANKYIWILLTLAVRPDVDIILQPLNVDKAKLVMSIKKGLQDCIASEYAYALSYIQPCILMMACSDEQVWLSMAQALKHYTDPMPRANYASITPAAVEPTSDPLTTHRLDRILTVLPEFTRLLDDAAYTDANPSHIKKLFCLKYIQIFLKENRTSTRFDKEETVDKLLSLIQSVCSYTGYKYKKMPTLFTSYDRFNDQLNSALAAQQLFTSTAFVLTQVDYNRLYNNSLLDSLFPVNVPAAQVLNA